jgi:hypothetical protein
MSDVSAPTKPTDKQLIYLRALIESRVIDFDLPENITAETIPDVIDKAKACPVRPASPEGFYLHDGRAYWVRVSKSSGHPYASVIEKDGIDTARWRFARWMANRVSVPLTVAEAARMGHASGICHVCASGLVRAECVAAGIHARCAKRLET